VCFMSSCSFPMANESPNCLILIRNCDGHTIVAFSSTCRSNIIVFESNQWLTTLFQQAKFWVPCNQKFAPWAFLKPNNDEFVSHKTKQVLCCIFCHSIPLAVHVLGSKILSKKGLMFYKIKIWNPTMKKHCEAKHFNI